MSARKRTLNVTWREAWPIWLVLALVLGFGALGVWVLLPAQIPTKVLRQGEDTLIKVGELQPNLPLLFAYPLEPGRATEFFVERDAGDKITVAFASCRRCYRSGHYRQSGHIFCGRCNEPMERATAGQTLSPEKDCTQIPIPFERSGDQLKIRAQSVSDTFAQWYTPVIGQADTPINGTQK